MDVSGSGNIAVVLLSMQSQKAQTYYNSYSEDERRTYRVINDRIFIFG